jgi:serine/threonine protein kinase/ketosteroid isomerase-like protein
MRICPVCRYCYEDEATACARGHGVLVPSRHGTRLIADKYRLERLLGRGGMGAVYAGVHVELDRPTAIKLLLPDLLWDGQALERFRREARAAARLNHPNIVDTYDYGLLPTGEAYIVMELVEGQTLREYMDAAHALPLEEAAHVARQIAEGIDVAHHGGIVHRDLKPSNIILARDHRGRTLVKVVDFGIAKLKEFSTTGGVGGVTNTGAIVGTPRYMSPEQCAGSEVDARSDIYSLAVILFEMLAGRPPFDAPSATALALKQVQEPPPPLRTLRAEVPDGLAELVMHALAKDPARRPQTAGEMARTLAAFEQAPGADDGEQTRDLSQARPPGLRAEAHATADSLKETGAPVLPSSTDRRRNAPPSTDRAGEPTGEVSADDDPSTASRDLPPVASAHVAEPVRRGRRLVLPLVLLGVVAALITIVALTRRGGVGSSNTETAGAPSPESPVARATPTNVTPSPSPAEAPAEEVNEAELVEPPESQRRAIVRALDRWVAATNARDLNAQLAHYAPRLTSFYLARGVSRESVRAEKQRAFGDAQGVEITIAEPSVRLARDGRTAVVRFRKQFRITSGGQSRTGEVLQELHWAREGSAWKITSERDLQVIR